MDAIGVACERTSGDCCRGAAEPEPDASDVVRYCEIGQRGLCRLRRDRQCSDLADAVRGWEPLASSVPYDCKADRSGRAGGKINEAPVARRRSRIAAVTVGVAQNRIVSVRGEGDRLTRRPVGHQGTCTTDVRRTQVDIRLELHYYARRNRQRRSVGRDQAPVIDHVGYSDLTPGVGTLHVPGLCFNERDAGTTHRITAVGTPEASLAEKRLPQAR